MSDELPPGCVFDFTVTDPEKRGTGAFSHWVYHIQTKTSLPSYKQRCLLTVRRYNHFAWLREQLVLEFPGCIVPPIPEKDVMGTLEKVVGGSGPSDLVAYRQRALRKFLVRVGAHHKLQHSAVLCDFLQLGDEEFNKRMKEPSKKTLDIVSLPPTLKLTGMSVPQTPEYAKWEGTVQYFDKLESLLVDMRAKMNRLMHCRVSKGTTFKEFGLLYMQAGDLEHHSGSKELGDQMKSLGEHTTKQEQLQGEHANNECVHVAESITYYQGMCASIKDAIKRLIKLHLTRDWLKESTRKADLKKEGAEGEARQKAIDKANSLETEFNKTSTAARDLSQELTDELSRFHREKSYDFKTLLSMFVDLTKDFSGKSRAAWTRALSAIDS